MNINNFPQLPDMSALFPPWHSAMESPAWQQPALHQPPCSHISESCVRLAGRETQTPGLRQAAGPSAWWWRGTRSARECSRWRSERELSAGRAVVLTASSHCLQFSKCLQSSKCLLASALLVLSQGLENPPVTRLLLLSPPLWTDCLLLAIQNYKQSHTALVVHLSATCS